MRRRNTPKPQTAPEHRCRECRESYDWHEADYQGQPFLCRCRHYKAGMYSKFLADRACRLFTPREA